MSTMAKEVPSRRRSRIHSEEFKASVVLASQQPGVSMASVALANGLNATMLRRWVVEAERGTVSPRLPSTALAHCDAKPAFVQMPLPEPAASGDIRIEVQRRALRVAVSWPTGAAAQCTAWLRELLRLSLVHSARLNGHDPYAYLRDVLERLPTQPASRVEELLPHRWSPAS